MIKLPRLPLGYEKVPGLFPRYWDQAMSNIEKAVNEVLALPEIQAAIDAANASADAANASAATANSAADAAQASADSQAAESSLVTSYIDPSSFTGDLISSTSAGVVTIKTHSRIYGNPSANPAVTVTGGTFTASGVSTGDILRVSYIDALRAGGVVSYTYTVDPDPPEPQAGNVHVVGAVSVPATGSSSGQYARPPGYIDPALL